MASIGLFDVKGLIEIDPSFQFSSPLFDRIEIATGKKTIAIEASRTSSDDVYLQSVLVNGKPRDSNGIQLKELKKGATLKFEIGSTPNEKLFNAGN